MIKFSHFLVNYLRVIVAVLGLSGSSAYASRELFEAIYKGDAEAVRLLLEGGDDVNDPYHYHTFEPFEDKPVDIRVRLHELHGSIPIYYAIVLERKEILELLVERGADLNSNGKSEIGPPIMYAARIGNLEAVAALLKRGVNVDQVDGEGRTPLMVAALEDQTEVALYLLKKGANQFIDMGAMCPEDTFSQGLTARHFAFIRRNEPLLAEMRAELAASNSATSAQDLVLENVLISEQILSNCDSEALRAFACTSSTNAQIALCVNEKRWDRRAKDFQEEYQTAGAEVKLMYPSAFHKAQFSGEYRGQRIARSMAKNDDLHSRVARLSSRIVRDSCSSTKEWAPTLLASAAYEGDLETFKFILDQLLRTRPAGPSLAEWDNMLFGLGRRDDEEGRKILAFLNESFPETLAQIE